MNGSCNQTPVDNYFKFRKKSEKRSSQPSSAMDVLHTFLEKSNSPLSQQFVRWKLWRKWSDVVGAEIAKNTEPVSYYKGCLYIWVKNSVWHQQMLFLAEPIREKVNLYVKKEWAKKIYFTLDRHSVPQLKDSDPEVWAYLEDKVPNPDK